ncbi:MAG: hypothetical protein HKO94_03700 [Flavobacteriaceae bacterium]|nr:hypothetical protein [Flavobacteriaceae bacterium]
MIHNTNTLKLTKTKIDYHHDHMRLSANALKCKIPVIRWFFCFLLIQPFISFAQSYDGLTPLENHQTNTYYSSGAAKQAEEMAMRCDRVMSFYKSHIGFQPAVTLLVLSESDWNSYTDFPLYGMPHYSNKNTLVVASHDNDFWKSFIPPLDMMPKELTAQITETYSNKNGGLTMRGFFDLLAIHELGHVYHEQGGLTMQRKWMGELFANILLHTYIAEQEPELLPLLTAFPKMVVSTTDKSTLKFTTLNELETNYDIITQQYPNNYGWYQSRWHIAAGDIYDDGGVQTIKNLWNTLKTHEELLDNSSFESVLLNQVHQSVAEVQLKWDD